MEKILFGLNLNNDMIDGVKGEIANFGVEFAPGRAEDDYKRTKDAVIRALTDKECDYTVCILSESLQRSAPFTTDDFDYIRTENEKTLIIPIVRNNYKGTDYMKRLEAVGITGALFDADATMANIAAVIKDRGRSRKVCKIYYNIDTSNIKEAKEAVSSFDPVESVAILNDISGKLSATERAEKLMSSLTAE